MGPLVFGANSQTAERLLCLAVDALKAAVRQTAAPAKGLSPRPNLPLQPLRGGSSGRTAIAEDQPSPRRSACSPPPTDSPEDPKVHRSPGLGLAPPSQRIQS